MVLIVATVTVFWIIGYALGYSVSGPVFAVWISYCLGLLLFYQIASRWNQVNLASWLLLVGLWGAVSSSAWQAGGGDTPAVVVLPLLPVLSIFLLGRRSLPICVLAVAFTLLSIHQSGASDTLLRPVVDEATHQLLQLSMLGLLTLFAALFGWYCEYQCDGLHSQLNQLANLDGLTGVANRRLFDERLQQEWLRNQRVNNCVALLLIDIDHFKQYNDTYGHVEGDRCLKTVAQAIAMHCRRSGELVARYGGEEFAMILPNVGLLEAGAIADSVLSDVAQLHQTHGDYLKRPVTVSIGFTSAVPHHAEQRESFIAWVDQALYRAKQGGRNRSVAAHIPVRNPEVSLPPVFGSDEASHDGHVKPAL